METNLSRMVFILSGVLGAFALFTAGYALGQNRFGQPRTILHVVEIKWKPGVTDAQKQKVLDGVKKMAGKIPGIENIWLKPARLEPRDFNAAFVIEFRSRAAADAYAESPVHDAWDTIYLPLREASFSIQVTN